MYYVYQLIDPRSSRPFYVGKGKGQRAWAHTALVKRGKSSGNRRKDALIAALLGDGLEPKIEIVAQYHDEQDAFDHEIDLIAATSGLLNIRKGGEGFRLSAVEHERRAKIRDIKRKYREHIRTREALRVWLNRAAQFQRATFPGLVNGEAKANELIRYVRQSLSMELPSLESRLANI